MGEGEWESGGGKQGGARCFPRMLVALILETWNAARKRTSKDAAQAVGVSRDIASLDDEGSRIDSDSKGEASALRCVALRCVAVG